MELRSVAPQRLQIPPLRYASVGMTRGEWLLFGRVATWMDEWGYFVRPDSPCIT